MGAYVRSAKYYVVNIGLAIGTVVIFFVICEAVTRVSLYVRGRYTFERMIKSPLPSSKTSPASMVDIIQPSVFRKVVYEGRPLLDVKFMGVVVTTNKEGWRMREISREKARGVVRIVGLGDSHMFGWGVRQDKTYLAVLEEELNSQFPARRWEVINTALIGYNTVMEIEMLKEKAIAYKPDLVLVEFIGNDLDLPNFLYIPPDPFSLKNSYFFEFLLYRKDLLAQGMGFAPASIMPGTNRYETDPKRVPARYRDLVGWKNLEKSLKELVQLKDKYKFEVMFCITQRPPAPYTLAELKKTLRRQGFYVLTNIQNITNKSLILSSQDTHPSEKAHGEKAKVILDFMKKERILNKLVPELSNYAFSMKTR